MSFSYSNTTDAWKVATGLIVVDMILLLIGYRKALMQVH